MMAKDQIKFIDGQTRVFTDTVSGNILEPISESGVEDPDQDYVTYKIKEWCSQSIADCPAGTMMAFKIAGVNNP
jgi:hypothetical protein